MALVGFRSLRFPVRKPRGLHGDAAMPFGIGFDVRHRVSLRNAS
jgi:hypothetical protein